MESGSGDPRFNSTKEARDLMSKIDDRNFFGLSKNNIQRSQLYLYAVALGLELGERTQLHDYASLVLDSSVEHSVESLLFAQAISEALTINPDIIEAAVDKRNVYHLSDEYANTGFIQLGKIYEKYSDDESAYIFKAIDGLDTLFKRNVENK